MSQLIPTLFWRVLPEPLDGFLGTRKTWGADAEKIVRGYKIEASFSCHRTVVVCNPHCHHS